MGRQSGVYQDAQGRWRVDRVHRGERLQGRFDTYQDAEAWLIARCSQIDAFGPVRTRSMTLADAATKYLLEEQAKGKVSLKSEPNHLMPVVEHCADLQLDQVHDDTLRRFVDARLTEGRSHKTVNLSLDVVRHIMNVAARKWRVDIGGGRTAPVLQRVPLLTMLTLAGNQRQPQPISWQEQHRLLPLLPTHLARMSLFMLNTGARDGVVCSLWWDWEVELELDGLKFSVFQVPRELVKGRKKKYDCIVWNSVAQTVVESMRGLQAENVFVWRRERTSLKKLNRHETRPSMAYRPVDMMNNTAFQAARETAELSTVRVHDLRHTYAQRLRDAGVSEEDRALLLGHAVEGMARHYATATVARLIEMANSVQQTQDRTTLLRVVNA